MSLIQLALTILLLLLWLNAAAVVGARFTQQHSVGKAAVLLVGCLLLFFVEHFVGLGKPTWLWPLITLVSVGILWSERARWQTLARAEVPFLIGFAYAFAWRFAFPAIDPQSEHLTDLYFIANYLNGDRLPPPDLWLAGYKFNMYYAFQHYAAAWIGRLLALDVGTTYNLAFCLLVGLSISLAWTIVRQLCNPVWSRVLTVAAFAIGGTGAAPILHKIAEGNTTLWSGIRFIGNTDLEVNTDFGRWLLPAVENPPGFVPLDLPLETFSYLIFLGDFHPPLGSFMLLMLTVACMVRLEKDLGHRTAQGLLGLSIPLSVIINTWVFPLQGLLITGWAGYRLLRRQPVHWGVLVGSAALGFVLIYPFLTEFIGQAVSPAMKLVEAGEHTPWRSFLVLHWPLMMLLLLAFWQGKRQPLGLMLAAVWLVLFVFTEMIYVDDVYLTKFNRFNTVLKWWSWVYAGALVTLGALNMGGPSRVARYGTALVLVLVCTYGWDLGKHWVTTPKTDLGRFHGHRWFTHDATNRAMLYYLRHAPPGVVLERHDKNAYTYSAALTTFAEKQSLIGWPDHEKTWRGWPNFINIQGGLINQFYAGTKADSLDWLLANEVRYIVWRAEDNNRDPDAWNSIGTVIAPHYHWHEFYAADNNYKVGIWVRRKL